MFHFPLWTEFFVAFMNMDSAVSSGGRVNFNCSSLIRPRNCQSCLVNAPLKPRSNRRDILYPGLSLLCGWIWNERGFRCYFWPLLKRGFLSNAKGSLTIIIARDYLPSVERTPNFFPAPRLEICVRMSTIMCHIRNVVENWKILWIRSFYRLLLNMSRIIYLRTGYLLHLFYFYNWNRIYGDRSYIYYVI